MGARFALRPGFVALAPQKAQETLRYEGVSAQSILTLAQTAPILGPILLMLRCF